jgi:hypothetical protein
LVSNYLLKGYRVDISDRSEHRAPEIVEVLRDLARTIRLQLMRQFRKRQVLDWLRKAHPHPGESEQVGALPPISGTLSKKQ